MNFNLEKYSRRIHPIIAPIIFIQLSISVFTGFMVTFYERILNQEAPKILMQFHQGKIYFIPYSRSIFTFIYFIILTFGSIISIPLMKKIWKKEFWRINSIKSIHSFVSTFLFLFYILISFTGMLYRNLREIFQLENVSIILRIHAMTFNDYLQIIYISFISFFTIILLITGFIQWINWIFKRKLIKS